MILLTELISELFYFSLHILQFCKGNVLIPLETPNMIQILSDVDWTMPNAIQGCAKVGVLVGN